MVLVYKGYLRMRRPQMWELQKKNLICGRAVPNLARYLFAIQRLIFPLEKLVTDGSCNIFFISLGFPKIFRIVQT